ncbi:MAG: thioredoxin family protein, partial [Chitinophagaceae bacterium]
MKCLHRLLPFALVFLFAFTRHNDPLPIGSAIPKADLKLKDISGRQASLKESMKPNGLLV